MCTHRNRDSHTLTQPRTRARAHRHAQAHAGTRRHAQARAGTRRHAQARTTCHPYYHPYYHYHDFKLLNTYLLLSLKQLSGSPPDLAAEQPGGQRRQREPVELLLDGHVRDAVGLVKAQQVVAHLRGTGGSSEGLRYIITMARASLKV